MTLLPNFRFRSRFRDVDPLSSLRSRNDSHSSPRRTRIIHIINDLSIGGAEMMLYKLLSEVDRTQFDLVVVSLRNRGQLKGWIQGLGIPVYSVAMRLPLPTPTACWRLIRLVRNLNADLIQGWMYHGNLAAQIAGAFARPATVVWNIRQSLYGFEYEKRSTAALIKISSWLSSLPAKIIYNSRIAAAQHGAIGYRSQKSLVIPNGFNTSLFKPSVEARRLLRIELGVSEDALLIGLVSRFHPVKDHHNFLHAAALLLKSHSDAHFVLCGKHVNWANPALCSLIDKLKLGERVHLLDQRRDMAQVTAGLDIATSSSCAESFPNVIGEAMSCEVPCVVTDVGDLVWILGDTGRVVPPRNAQALAAGMRELVEIGPEGRSALGKAARERILTHFPVKAIESMYQDLYDDVLRPVGESQESGASNVRYHEFGEHSATVVPEEELPVVERPAAG